MAAQSSMTSLHQDLVAADASDTIRRVDTSSERENFHCEIHTQLCLTVVIAGASGDLARKKTYPALQFLWEHGFLCRNVQIIGYSRTALTDEELRARLRPTLAGDTAEKELFLSRCTYVAGDYDSTGAGAAGFQRLAEALAAREVETPCSPTGRLFYLALPPVVYPQVCKGLKTYCDSGSSLPGSWIRVVVEKPFGQDLDSSERLVHELGALYPEEQLYRIDHYLGKEMTQNMLVMRFSNVMLSRMWDRISIANVQITFKEDIGTQGRGGYFDSFGIIRDVIQNHLTQMLAYVAMEKPLSVHPDDIRDEKVKVLRCIRPPRDSQVVLGQYTAADGQPGYLDDPTVPDGSCTPTFASMVLYIDNDRWAGVPFVIKAGKALDGRKAEIRLQLRATPHWLFGGDPESMRNELVVRLQPDEAIYTKLVVKKPGLGTEPVISELDLDYKERYPNVIIPDAYPKLILDAIRGDQQFFVRRDELRAAWAIYTPLLHAIDAKQLPVHPYAFGSRGPAQADELLENVGFVRSEKYTWERQATGFSPRVAAASL